MSRLWNWLTVTEAKPKQSTMALNNAKVGYNSRLDVSITITGDIDYALRMLPIVAKQLEAADGRLTDAA